MPKHEQVELTDAPGILVDAGLAPLLGWWISLGCRTLFSCEADGASAYVMFAGAEDLEVATRVLAQLAREHGDAALALRVLGCVATPFGPGDSRRVLGSEAETWEYQLRWMWDHESGTGPHLRALLYFPCQDLDRCVDLVAAATRALL